jgi:hypothetical protein
MRGVVDVDILIACPLFHPKGIAIVRVSAFR